MSDKVSINRLNLEQLETRLQETDSAISDAYIAVLQELKEELRSTNDQLAQVTKERDELQKRNDFLATELVNATELIAETECKFDLAYSRLDTCQERDFNEDVDDYVKEQMAERAKRLEGTIQK